LVYRFYCLLFPFFTAELERKVVEASSVTDALKKSLDAEVSECSALEAVVTSACEGLGVRQTHQGPLYGVASRLCTPRTGRGRRIGVLSVGPCHAGVKKALAMVSSHYVGIDLSAVSEGYVVPDDEAEA